jgi:hypothetical protein
METDEESIRTKEKIIEALEPEEIRLLREDIESLKKELDELDDFEMDEDEVDNRIDDVYPEVDIAGVKYTCSRVLKEIDECRYDEIKNDFEDEYRSEKTEELQDELDELEAELESKYEDNEEEGKW